jgi:hypothetical protein
MCNSTGGILVDTESVSGMVGSGPLGVGEFLESAPKVVLSSSDVNGVTFWASVDWFTGSNCLLEVLVVPAGLEEKDDDHDVKNGKSDKNETEHLSTSESSDETSVNRGAASEGNSGVGVDSDSHTNVTGNDGGHGSGKVGGGGVWEVGWSSVHVHLEEIDGGSENDSERAGPDGEPDVFLVEESFGTFGNFGTNEGKSLHDLFNGSLFLSTGLGSLFFSFTEILDAFLYIN